MPKTHIDNQEAALQIKQKGWSYRLLAIYWGISRQHIYGMIGRENKGKFLACAVAGLPVLTKKMKGELEGLAKEKSDRTPRKKVSHSTGYQPGDGITCLDPYEGWLTNHQGWIKEIRGTKKNAEILISRRGNDLWVPISSFEVYFCPNGKTLPGVES